MSAAYRVEMINGKPVLIHLRNEPAPQNVVIIGIDESSQTFSIIVTPASETEAGDHIAKS